MEKYQIIFHKIYKIGYVKSVNDDLSFSAYFPSLKEFRTITKDDFSSNSLPSKVKDLFLFNLIQLNVYDGFFAEHDIETSQNIFKNKLLKIIKFDIDYVEAECYEDNKKFKVIASFDKNFLKFSVNDEIAFNSYTYALILFIKNRTFLPKHLIELITLNEVKKEENSKVLPLYEDDKDKIITKIKDSIFINFFDEYQKISSKKERLLYFKSHLKEFLINASELKKFHTNLGEFKTIYDSKLVTEVNEWLMLFYEYTNANQLVHKNFEELSPKRYKYLNSFTSRKLLFYLFLKDDFKRLNILAKNIRSSDMAIKDDEAIIFSLSLNKLDLIEIDYLYRTVTSLDLESLKNDESYLTFLYPFDEEFIKNEIGFSKEISQDKFHNDLVKRNYIELRYDFTFCTALNISKEDPSLVYTLLYSSLMRLERFISVYNRVLKLLRNNSILLKIGTGLSYVDKPTYDQYLECKDEIVVKNNLNEQKEANDNAL